MILSHRHKFIFIKTAKTAGTSIEVFLAKHCGREDVVTPVFPPIEGHTPRNYQALFNPLPEMLVGLNRLGDTAHDVVHRRKFYNHMRAVLIRSRISTDIWRSYFKFCVERNPWDKVLSHYHMHRHRAGGALSLEKYFTRGKFPINYPRYTDRSGREIIVDRVVRYEKLHAGLGAVFAHLGIPFSGSFGTDAKTDYRADRAPYWEVFTDAQRRLIEQKFAREIELHGYGFEPEIAAAK